MKHLKIPQKGGEIYTPSTLIKYNWQTQKILGAPSPPPQTFLIENNNRFLKFNES